MRLPHSINQRSWLVDKNVRLRSRFEENLTNFEADLLGELPADTNQPNIDAARAAARLFYATNKPIGLVLWARVDDDVAKRLADGTTKLRPQDWKSGDQLWVVEVIAPFGGPEEMIKDLKAKVFPNEDIRYVAMSKDGAKEVKVV